ncbi:MAG TPA: large conductance mechanosensitive channel protein MscL [Paenalcaligenes sp.]|nr:large conductance mechanosensitive channel protein MscL [Paenalcaligenes sp.]
MSRSSSFLKEFREFAVRGNMVDLAVGVIIGGAFGKIIDSLVNDIIMPIISYILGGDVDFANYFTVLRTPEGYTGPHTLEELNAAGAVVFAWGHFITILVNFTLLAFVVFLLVKMINKMRRTLEREQEQVAAEEPPAPAEEVVLLREIRDSLKTQDQSPSK